MDENESKSITVDEISTEEIESECVHKTQTIKKTQILRQNRKKLQLRMIQLSRSRENLTYLNMEGIS